MPKSSGMPPDSLVPRSLAALQRMIFQLLLISIMLTQFCCSYAVCRLCFFLAGGLLKIEDILPFFPDFVTIDNFKAAITDSLTRYNKQIQELKGEMDEATEIAGRHFLCLSSN